MQADAALRTAPAGAEETGGPTAAGGNRRTAAGGRFALKVVTYNIHRCIDRAGVADPEQIAAVIAPTGADVVALQEVDADRPRTGRIHQGRRLAERLGMRVCYFPVIRPRGGCYGLAVLSRFEYEEVQFGRLPAPRLRRPREARGAMWLRLATSHGPIHLVNTHLGLQARERRMQIEALLGDQWLGALGDDAPLVLCGDFNAGLRSYVYRRVVDRLADVHRLRPVETGRRATFFSFYPLWCLDHIFVSSHLTPLRVAVPSAPPAPRASDHLPVFAALAFAAAPEEGP